MAARVRAHDWASTPLGPPDAWPATLRTTLSLMLGSVHPMFVAWGPDLTFFFNDGYAPILGSKLDGALGRPFAGVWSEIWTEIGPLVARALAGEGIWSEDVAFRLSRNGYEETAWFTFSYSPVFDETGAVRGLLGAVNETTDKVRADRARTRLAAERHDAAERLQRMFDQAPTFMAELSGPEHRVTSFNAAYGRLVGERPILGRTVRESLPEADAQGYLALLDRVYGSGEPYVGRGALFRIERTPDALPRSVYVDFVYQPLRGDDGRVAGIFVVGHDVTEQHRAIAALRDSEARFRLIAQGVFARQFVWDLTTRFVTLPKPVNLIFELGDEPVHEDRVFEKVHPDDLASMNAGMAPAFDPQGDGQMRANYRVVRSDGSVRWVDSSGQVQFETGPDGLRRPVRVFGVVWDVTEQHRMLESLQEADRRKDEFLAMLAHELRNPLAPMRNANRVLEREPVGERGRQALDMSQRQLRHLTRLVDDLLEVSRITRGLIELRREPVLVQHVVHSAADGLGDALDQRGQRLALEMPDRPVSLHADPVRLAQIVENLLTNASKYTDPGGDIRVRVAQSDGTVTIEVRDSGIGIAPDQMPRLFGMFAQVDDAIDRSRGGLGIGLALVKRLAELHGGTVGAASAGLGLGSTFTVRLPQGVVGGTGIEPVTPAV